MKSAEQKAKKVPAIRFAGFDDEWVEKKILDLLVQPITDGPHETPNLVEEGIPFISVDAIVDNKIDFSRRRGFITEEYDFECCKKYKPELNDVYLVKSGSTVGKTAIVETTERFNIWSPLAAMRSGNKTDPYFLFFLLQTKNLQNQVFDKASHGTQPNLSMRELEKFLAIVTQRTDEQNRIGSFQKKMEQLVSFEQKKYDKLTQVKKSMLEKMFPKEGATVPEIRFAGFTGDWERNKLGNMGTTFTGLSGKTKTDFGHGKGKFVTYMNVFLNPVSDPNRTESVEIDNTQNSVQCGDVFFTTSSETPDEVGMSSVWLEKTENTYLNSFCFGYRPTVKIDSFYLAYMLRSNAVRKKITYLAQGISRYNISKNGVMEIDVPLPSIDEQQKIGSYFSHLDSLISLQQRKLEKLKNIKKSLLEKMFV